MELTYGLNDIDTVAEKLIKVVNSKTILLHGGMGVGKTTLVKAIVRALGSNDEVNSPTFSIINEYLLNEGLLYHFDLYRINDIEETYNFGIEEYLYSDNWIIIEWPEVVKPILDDVYTNVYLEEKTSKLRSIRLKI